MILKYPLVSSIDLTYCVVIEMNSMMSCKDQFEKHIRSFILADCLKIFLNELTLLIRKKYRFFCSQDNKGNFQENSSSKALLSSKE